MVIPAYNEAENIYTVVDEWYRILEKEDVGEESRLLVIDDGSKDETFQILNGMKEGRSVSNYHIVIRPQLPKSPEFFRPCLSIRIRLKNIVCPFFQSIPIPVKQSRPVSGIGLRHCQQFRPALFHSV